MSAKPSDCYPVAGVGCRKPDHRHAVADHVGSHAPNGETLCADCEVPVFYVVSLGEWFHTDPDAPSRFLCPTSRRG